MGGLQEKERVLQQRQVNGRLGNSPPPPPSSATGALSDVGEAIKVNVLYVVFKGAFLILHVLDLTVIPNSPKCK